MAIRRKQLKPTRSIRKEENIKGIILLEFTRSDVPRQAFLRKIKRGTDSSNSSSSGSDTENSIVPTGDLHADEIEICRQLSISFNNYSEVKNLLISEYNRRGPVRKSYAYKLTKLDTQKSKRIFEFLLSKKLIEQAPLQKIKRT